MVVNQNLQTLKMLEESSVEARLPTTSFPPIVFDSNCRTFAVGQWIDAKDSQDRWVASSKLTSSKRPKSSR